MALSEITDHADRALARLLEQYKGRSKLANVLDVFSDQVQELETAFFQLLEERAIETGEGSQLDTIGEIVGQARNGLDDATYRLYLRVRIKTNLSSGLSEQLITIVSLLVGDTVTVHLSDEPPAGISISLEDDDVSDDTATVVLYFAKLAKSAGVRLVLIWNPDSDMFAFDDAGSGFDGAGGAFGGADAA